MEDMKRDKQYDGPCPSQSTQGHMSNWVGTEQKAQREEQEGKHVCEHIKCELTWCALPE